MQTKSSFNVIGPGGTAYYFRRTRRLPEASAAFPLRMPASIPVDPIKGETGYIMRRGRPIWGSARFNLVRAQWFFEPQPGLAETTQTVPRADPKRANGGSDPAESGPSPAQ